MHTIYYRFMTYVKLNCYVANIRTGESRSVNVNVYLLTFRN